MIKPRAETGNRSRRDVPRKEYEGSFLARDGRAARLSLIAEDKMLVLLLAFIQLSIGAAPEKAGPAPNPFKNDDSDAADPTLPYALIEGIDLFTVPLEELAKNERPATTLSEQCKQFLPHFHYYCRSSNIAKYNEEIRIICERYEAYCSDRVLPSINHVCCLTFCSL
uniref:Uncharacterized protein n=1 Tax=Pristionchus pacificus TaxID=54126 RepID=A0A2A6B3T1_PRIPA|eukprot:PDM60518.1 hypothetical protein PRIPAC_53496 [Pristionchus pacificus]